MIVAPTLADYLHGVYVPSRLDLGETAIQQYSIAISILERWAGRSLTLADLDEQLICRWLRDYKATGKSGRTVNNKRQAVLTLWQHGYDWDYIGRPPRLGRVPRARENPPLPTAWTVEEVGRLFHEARKLFGRLAGMPRKRYVLAAFGLYYDTGCRHSELHRLRTADVDLSKACVIFRHTKTGKPRWCPLHQSTVDSLSRIYDIHRELLLPMPLCPSALRRRVQLLYQRAGVSYGRAEGGLHHKWRRTHATLVEANGGEGHLAIGDTRQVFLASYWDRSFSRSHLEHLPRPVEPGS